MLRSLLVSTLVASFVALVAMTAACDILPDKCDEGAARCIGNIAETCKRPGPEAHSDWTQTSCGTAAVCFISADQGAQCGRKDTAAGPTATVACDSAGTFACTGAGVLSQCVADKAGGTTWVDSPCPSYWPVCHADAYPTEDGGVRAGCAVK